MWYALTCTDVKASHQHTYTNEVQHCSILFYVKYVRRYDLYLMAKKTFSPTEQQPSKTETGKSQRTLLRGIIAGRSQETDKGSLLDGSLPMLVQHLILLFKKKINRPQTHMTKLPCNSKSHSVKVKPFFSLTFQRRYPGTCSGAGSLTESLYLHSGDGSCCCGSRLIAR